MKQFTLSSISSRICSSRLSSWSICDEKIKNDDYVDI